MLQHFACQITDKLYHFCSIGTGRMLRSPVLITFVNAFYSGEAVPVWEKDIQVKDTFLYQAYLELLHFYCFSNTPHSTPLTPLPSEITPMTKIIWYNF